MRGRIVLILLLVAGCRTTSPVTTPANDLATLEAALRARVDGFRGDVGFHLEHLPSGRSIGYRADTLFPTASMVKIPILVGVFRKMREGAFTYEQTHPYDTLRLYPGVDVVGGLKHGEPITTHKLAFLMVSFSDNTASLWLQELAGTGTAINAEMEALGLAHTRVNSRTPGREADWRAYGWGQTTPREMATLLRRIHNGEVVDRAASDEMYRLLTKTLWDKTAIAPIPPYIQVASKQGAVNRSRSEVLLVHAPEGPYVLCVITKNQEDTSWTDDNEGWRLIQDLSAMVWRHFAPNDGWTPP